MVFRCILPPWAVKEYPNQRRVLEGEFSEDRLKQLNAEFYNIYFLPNHPSNYQKGVTVDGSHIDVFNYVFVDMDLKEGKYESKEQFIAVIKEAGLKPSSIVDSGNGVHVYWQVSDLDAMSFLRLQRRLMRKFNTDEAVAKIYQLMRVPGTVNTKNKEHFKLCELLEYSDCVYTCEDLDRFLPPISHEDEEYCKQHHDKTYRAADQITVDDKIPLKFAQLIRSSQEAKDIWSGKTDDRSKSDFRLGHIMFASGFTKEEARSVLVNSSKALERAPVHRINYAESIIDKIWTYEMAEYKTGLNLSSTVKEILERSGDTIKGTRFPCHKFLDNTEHGFRLGQVIGLVAGSGVGKTMLALNMFRWFAERNPDYEHFFIPLEQPANEIAYHWRTICQGDDRLHEKVHILSNYDEDGNFRHLSLDEIKDYLLKFQEKTKKKIGCVVVDHIGALKKQDRNGENQGLMEICHAMKAFAIQTNTLMVMQSQAPREKAGIGDLELNKDAAYGTVYFESYCDYLITMWQPLKRCYVQETCPTITAYKFCKIRHKKQGVDAIKEDACYKLFFDPTTERLRELTQDEEKGFSFWVKNATNKRKKDRNTDIITYTSVRVEGLNEQDDKNSKSMC